MVTRICRNLAWITVNHNTQFTKGLANEYFELRGNSSVVQEIKRNISSILGRGSWSTHLQGQWNTNGNAISSSNNPVQLTYQNGGYTGPTLEFYTTAGYGLGNIDFYTYGGQTVPSARWQAADAGNFQASHILYTSQGGSPNQPLQARLTVAGNGNVGIGTTAPAHLLHVAGVLGAEEVIVSSSGADYVFQPDYRLRPLTEVKEYIKEHHHLPEIPSAREVSEKGMNLGDMQAKLLAKVEELTLHMIRAEEENRELRERLARVESSSGKAKE